MSKANFSTLTSFLGIFFLGLISLGLALSQPASAGTIKKCQDEKGQWHYGDTAAAACAKSKVIEINQEGIKKREIAAPPTEKELKEKAKHAAEAKKRAVVEAEQKRRDKRLLATYGHEKDIAYVRDRKLRRIDATIQASQRTITSFQAILKRLEGQAAREQRSGGKISAATAENITQTKNQIAEHEKVIINAGEEKDQSMITRSLYSTCKTEGAQVFGANSRIRSFKSSCSGRAARLVHSFGSACTS